jgi:hypothetical protein
VTDYLVLIFDDVVFPSLFLYLGESSFSSTIFLEQSWR